MRGGTPTRPVVESYPEDVGPMVTMHAGWSADNGRETAVFATEQEAVEFCRRHWRREPVVLDTAGLREGEG